MYRPFWDTGACADVFRYRLELATEAHTGQNGAHEANMRSKRICLPGTADVRESTALQDRAMRGLQQSNKVRGCPLFWSPCLHTPSFFLSNP